MHQCIPLFHYVLAIYFLYPKLICHFLFTNKEHLKKESEEAIANETQTTHDKRSLIKSTYVSKEKLKI